MKEVHLLLECLFVMYHRRKMDEKAQLDAEDIDDKLNDYLCIYRGLYQSKEVTDKN